MSERKPLIIIESPLAGEMEENVKYAKACVVDSLKRGEAPFASHLLYAQSGILDDNIPDERTMGIEAGLSWGRVAEKTVVYLDRGMSSGMEKGIKRAEEEGRPVEYRYLYTNL